MTLYDGWGLMTVGVPHLELAASLPGLVLWGVTATVCLLLFGASFAIPERATPWMYALRAVLLVQASALVYFLFWAEHWPYDLAGYLQTMMATGLAIASVTPLVLGFIWHVRDVGWAKKLALVGVMQAYSVVLVPLQYAVQGLVLEHATMLFLPALYILFGIPLHILTLVALYAWGMSWEGAIPALGVPLSAAAPGEAARTASAYRAA